MDTKTKEKLLVNNVSKVSSLADILLSSTIYLPGKSSAGFFGSLVAYTVTFESEFIYDVKTRMLRLKNMSIEKAYKKGYWDFVSKFNITNMMLRALKKPELDHEVVIRHPKVTKLFNYFNIWMGGYYDPIMSPDLEKGLCALTRAINGNKCHICSWFKEKNKKLREGKKIKFLDVMVMTRSGKKDLVTYFPDHINVPHSDKITLVHSGNEHVHMRYSADPYVSVMEKHMIAIDEMLFRITTKTTARFSVSTHLFKSSTYISLMMDLIKKNETDKIRILTLTYMFIKLGMVPIGLIHHYRTLSYGRTKKEMLLKFISTISPKIMNDAFFITLVGLALAGKMPNMIVDNQADFCYRIICGKKEKFQVTGYMLNFLKNYSVYTEKPLYKNLYLTMRFITFFDGLRHPCMVTKKKKRKKQSDAKFDCSRVLIFKGNERHFVNTNGCRIVMFDCNREEKKKKLISEQINVKKKSLVRLGFSRKTVDASIKQTQAAQANFTSYKQHNNRRGGRRNNGKQYNRRKAKRKVHNYVDTGKNVYAQGTIYKQQKTVSVDSYVMRMDKIEQNQISTTKLLSALCEKMGVGKQQPPLNSSTDTVVSLDSHVNGKKQKVSVRRNKRKWNGQPITIIAKPVKKVEKIALPLTVTKKTKKKKKKSFHLNMEKIMIDEKKSDKLEPFYNNLMLDAAQYQRGNHNQYKTTKDKDSYDQPQVFDPTLDEDDEIEQTSDIEFS